MTNPPEQTPSRNPLDTEATTALKATLAQMQRTNLEIHEFHLENMRILDRLERLECGQGEQP
ncbi:MAG: hypothetical protein H7Y22_02190 [Gemmatimonadaceae bacterium]|nr:hypothetical protein [Gloeobacterales cyanobacterium ES-bin-141]